MRTIQMNFLSILDRAGVTVPADGAANTQVLVPYLSVEDVEHFTLETLVHELHLGNLLGAFELRVYAAACSAQDPEVVFRGPLLLTLDLMGANAGEVRVALPRPHQRWGTGVAVDAYVESIPPS